MDAGSRWPERCRISTPHPPGGVRGMQLTRPGAPIVLIAERDRLVRDLESYALERSGFRVEFADDGQEALARIRLSLPALLITEILLPRMDGLTLCRQLSEDPSTRDVPVIVFSVL